VIIYTLTICDPGLVFSESQVLPTRIIYLVDMKGLNCCCSPSSQCFV